MNFQTSLLHKSNMVPRANRPSNVRITGKRGKACLSRGVSLYRALSSQSCFLGFSPGFSINSVIMEKANPLGVTNLASKTMGE